MSPETMERIFEPFFTTKEEGRGVGLGLSMVYGIIREHRGSIQVDSEEGKGASFRVTLPMVKNEPVGGAAS
jgi:signal transduction histidine kinase